jgi:hypothetical protein
VRNQKYTTTPSKSTASRRSPRDQSKREARPVLATSLPFGSAKQFKLVHARITRNLCLECGRPRVSGDYQFCQQCIAASQKSVEVALPLDAWSYRVTQVKPALPGCGAFIGERVGIYERKHKSSEIICVNIDSFKQAKLLVLRTYKRVAGAW